MSKTNNTDACSDPVAGRSWKSDDHAARGEAKWIQSMPTATITPVDNTIAARFMFDSPPRRPTKAVKNLPFLVIDMPAKRVKHTLHGFSHHTVYTGGAAVKFRKDCEVSTLRKMCSMTRMI